MAGEAKTSEFLLTTATLMLGPSADVFSLTPDEHSLGLVKNVQVTAETAFVELTQGIQAQIVASVNTGNTTRISAEVYEYTARNLAYGAYLDGSEAQYDQINTQYALGAPVAAGGDEITLAAGSGTDIGAADWLVIQDTNSPDRLHVGKVESVAADVVTLAAGYEMPAGMAFAVATTVVYRVQSLNFGSVAKQPTYGCKLVGLLPETGQPVTLIFPKVKVTRGLQLAFQTENFSNMPFEFAPYALTPTDPFYGEFGSMKTWKLLRT